MNAHNRRPYLRVFVALSFGALGLAIASQGRAQVPPLSCSQTPFFCLESGFTQALFGTGPATPNLFGGVAFAPDGDVWVDGCAALSFGSPLFRFELQSTITIDSTTVHPQATSPPDPPPGSPYPSDAGCGLVNHPDGTLYSNIDGPTGVGLANLDSNTAVQIRAFGPAGNALGIAVDPVTLDLIYVGADCADVGSNCTIFDVDPVTETSRVFGTTNSAQSSFIDGIYFDPTGQFLFMASRSPSVALIVMNRSGAIVQEVPMTSPPDGMAFHGGTAQFVVSNNNDGTVTRFDFPGNDYSQVPTQSVFANGGFRGDLTQVGDDGCLYLTQHGTRFVDGTTTSNDSVVQICGGFVPPLPPTSSPTPTPLPSNLPEVPAKAFLTAPLDPTHLTSLQSRCASLIQNGSGAGVCTCGAGENAITNVAPFVGSKPPFTDTFQISYYDITTSAFTSDAGYGGIGSSGGAGDNTVRIVNPTAQQGTLCAMIYVFDDNEQIEECCGCPVTPNGLRTLSVTNDLGSDFGVNGSRVTTGGLEVISSTPNFVPGNPPPAPNPAGTNLVCSPAGSASNDKRASAVNPVSALRSWITFDEFTEPGNIP